MGNPVNRRSPLSRRERNKQDKLQRIRRAASELFKARGFARTTTQEIADRADISSGTLFLYAPTKEDLLGIVMANDLLEIFERAFASVPRAKSLPDKVAHVFVRFLRYHQRHTELSIYFLRESIVTRDAGAPSATNLLVARIIDEISQIVLTEQRANVVRADLSASDIAWSIFALYCCVLGSFLSERLNLRQSIHAIRTRFHLQFEGLFAR